MQDTSVCKLNVLCESIKQDTKLSNRWMMDGRPESFYFVLFDKFFDSHLKTLFCH